MASAQGLDAQIRSSSLGTLGIEGHPAHELTLAIAAERGLNLIGFRSRGVDAERAESIDLFIALSSEHVRWLRTRFPEWDSDRVWLFTAPGVDDPPEDRQGIPDPVGADESEYRSTLESIDEGFPALWAAILGRI